MELTWKDVEERALRIVFSSEWKEHQLFEDKFQVGVYPIPSAGLYAAQVIVGQRERQRTLPFLYLVETPEEAGLFVDDVLDSGKTRQRYKDRYPKMPFVVLVDKKKEGIKEWVSFPWDRMKNEAGPEDNVRRLLEYIGEDPNREGLRETPARVVKLYQELFSGYKQEPEDVVKVFEDGACDEMVLVKNIEFASVCEHHMLPFIGVAHIAYIPDGKVIGVSKLVRLLEVFARRLQIQERLCTQVTTVLDDLLKPKGSACVIDAQHLCMSIRGVGKQQSRMVTSSLTGAFKQKCETRQEFMSMIKG